MDVQSFESFEGLVAKGALGRVGGAGPKPRPRLGQAKIQARVPRKAMRVFQIRIFRMYIYIFMY